LSHIFSRRLKTGENGERYSHTSESEKERSFATPFVKKPTSAQSEEKSDSRSDTGDQERDVDVLDPGLTEHDGEIVDSERVAGPLIEDPEVDDTGNTVDSTFTLKDGKEIPPTRIGSVCFDGSAIFRVLELDNLRVGVAESVVFL
jgi:hypothetical protein